MEGTANLLIVDDQLDNLRMLTAILNEQGYRVRKALDGMTAIEAAQAQVPDLILLDIKMPQMNGYKVCSMLKSFPHTCEIPVIFLSGMDGTADKVRAFAVGGADYITKPFEAEEVLVRVRQQITLRSQKAQLQQEIRVRRQAEAEAQLLLTTIQAVSEASDFESALSAMLGKVTHTIAWDYGEAWTPAPDAAVFTLNQTHYDPQDQSLRDFAAASQAYHFAYNIGLPGRVWATQQPEWIVDASQVSADVFLRSSLVEAARLKAAFAVPIVLDGKVLAVLAFFKRERSEFDAKLVHLVGAIALQLGGFMQRKQAEEALRQANQELHRLANVDGLTQIANRRCFDEMLLQEWKRLRREQSSLSLILCDIDFFKKYNDRYGHLAGDACLKQVAQAIEQSIRRPADLAARYGGEEFAVLLPNTDAEGAAHIASQIRAALASLEISHAASEASSFVTLSMGSATLIPASEWIPEDLIAAADRALYKAKVKGRNQCCSSE